jgi:hypothetical protein
MTKATAAMITAPPASTYIVSGSERNSAPSATATAGFTSAQVVAIDSDALASSQT